MNRLATRISIQLGYTIELHTAQDDAVVAWSTNNPRVATVEQDGTVIPQGPGTVTITAYGNKGGAKGTYRFKVVDPTMPTSIAVTHNGTTVPKAGLTIYSMPLTGQDSNTVQLGYTLQTSTASTGVAWSSSDVRIRGASNEHQPSRNVHYSDMIRERYFNAHECHQQLSHKGGFAA